VIKFKLILVYFILQLKNKKFLRYIHIHVFFLSRGEIYVKNNPYKKKNLHLNKIKSDNAALFGAPQMKRNKCNAKNG